MGKAHRRAARHHRGQARRLVGHDPAGLRDHAGDDRAPGLVLARRPEGIVAGGIAMKSRVALILLAASGLACAAGALPGPMSKAEYEAAKKDIKSDYRTAKVGCEPM